MDDFLAEHGDINPAQLAEVVRVDQRERRLGGEAVPAEAYLQRYAVLAQDPELALEVIWGEFLVRKELGEQTDVAEYLRRFPHHAVRLRQQDEVHRALASGSQLATGSTFDSRDALPATPPASDVPQAADIPFVPDVPGFEIVRPLGRGGMGRVYLAWQKSLKRAVALKIVRGRGADDGHDLARFRIEAEAVARLHHPNIVQVYEVGDCERGAFLVLEYLDGGNLAESIRGTPQPAGVAAERLEILARAVDHAHLCDIVHRDLKPANILLTADGVPKVADFGLAKILAGAGQSPTQTGDLMGTPSYMAPEQADGRARSVGPATDVYALGAILYEMLTGRPPFLAETPMETAFLVVTGDPVPPRRLQPKVPKDLETICLQCLQKEPRRRYASAREMAEDLRRFLEGKPVVARPLSWMERALKWSRRRPAAAVLIVVSLLIVLVGLPGVTWLWQQTAASLADVQNARRAERQQLADKLVALAHRDWVAGDLERAQQHLAECPAEFRGADWHYLSRACGACLLTFNKAAGVSGVLAWDPDSRRLAAGFGTVAKVWDAATGHDLLELPDHRVPINNLAFASGGHQLVTVGQFHRSVRQRGTPLLEAKVWDLAGGQLVRSFSHDERGYTPFMSFDGRRLAFFTADAVRLWDVMAGREIRTLAGAGLLRALSRDGERIATAPDDNTLAVWEAATGELSCRLEWRNARLHGPAFSADGRLIAGPQHGGKGNITPIVRVCDTVTRRDVCPPLDHADGVVSLAFDPSGRRLAASVSDKSIVLWDLSTGRELVVLRGHQHRVQCVEFSPDGQYLASASEGVVKTWDVRPFDVPPSRAAAAQQ